MIPLPARLCAFLFLLALPCTRGQTTLIPSGATWSYRAGTTEASNPTSAWRGLAFVESGWSSGVTPFWYGDVLSGTQISAMQNVHTTLFFRNTFTVTNPPDIGGMILNAKCDDGFIAWINGVEVARYNVTSQNPTIADVATASVAEPPPSVDYPLPDPHIYLVAGTNVLAVMGFNASLGSSDFGLDLVLRTTGPDATAPTIATINPPPGQVPALTDITVTFSEPVRGVTSDDLVINQTAATSVTGAGATWTFSFAQPPFGQVLVSFSPAHDITDSATPAHPFIETAPNAAWGYNLSDNIPPFVSGLNPPANATVNVLSQLEVTFSEPVTGVNASDLLINGVAASGVASSGVNRYTFTFPPQPNGAVSVAWIGASGIADLAVPPNAFTGGGWSYTVDPNAVLSSVRINEFVASNQTGLSDENAEKQDWIEIHNPTATAVSLDGWSLTDDESYPDKWIFPARTLPAGGYLVVFCSAKDRRPLTGNLHTNFKLGAPTGEYLALFNNQSPRQIVSIFSPEYPQQRNDYSYGIDAQGIWRYYATPTPGAANGTSAISGVVSEVNFSVNRGFFDTPFQLYLTCPTPGATIRYTIDGSAPGNASPIFLGPITINNTTCVRAAGFAPNTLPSLVRTNTFVFPGLVKNQSAAPPGFPTIWGGAGNQVAGDYEVDPNVTNSALYSATFTSDLLSIPSMSIVMNLEDIFGASGLNSNPGGSGLAWERAASLEMIYPDGRTGFQQDCGMRIQGGFGRSTSIKKHSFRPLFKGDYGASKLKFPLFDGSPVTEFDTFTLRAGMNNSYVLSTGEAVRATFTEDEWMRQTQRAMGQVSGYGNFVHLYINGLYWGLYNATERPSAPFAASHLGGEKEEWDALNSSEAIDGNKTAWTTLQNLCTSGGATRYLVDQNDWNQVTAYLDIDNLIDYMMINFYGGNQDWDDHNWYSARRRVTGAAYKFFSWDGERTLESPSGADRTTVNQGDKPSRLYAALRGNTAPTSTAPLNAANVEFRVRFADRIQKQMFVNGPLTPTEALARWNSIEAVIDRAVVGESARWGDTLREPPYTRNAEFLTEVNRKRNTQFPQRTSSMISQFRAAKLFPPTNLVAPVLSQHGGKLPAGGSITMTTTTAGTIYYTLDGSDPRQAWTAAIASGSANDWSGNVAPGALTYSGAVTLATSGVLKARVRETVSGLWSPLTEASFQVAELGVPLRITEVMYNPIGGNSYEFIEVQNVGLAAIDLGLMTFEGIDFTFLRNTSLAAGDRAVIASNVSPAQWASRYPGITPIGYFGGSLSNNGEYLAIRDAAGNIVTSFRYSDITPWSPEADGTGRSLELINPGGDPASPVNWRASTASNGTPGSANQVYTPAVRLNEVLARNNGVVNNGGAVADYVELYNAGATGVDLSGWSVRPGASFTDSCVFPPGTNLAPGAYLIVWCGTVSSGFQAVSELQDAGGIVTLNNDSGAVVDAIEWGHQVPDKSIGIVNGSWALAEPSPGAANVAAPLAPASQLAVNEFSTHPRTGSPWVEFTNRDATLPAALNGAYVQAGSGLQQIHSLSFISAGGYVAFSLNSQATALTLDLRLPDANSKISLYSPAAALVDNLSYTTTQFDVSQGRLPNGTGALISFPLAATPGAANAQLNYSGPLLNEVLARNKGVVLDSSGNWPDFIEWFNASASPFDMSGMRVGIDSLIDPGWEFPPGSLVPAGGYLRIWCDPSRLPDATNIGRALADSGGGVWLFNANGQQVDGIEYGPQAANFSIGKNNGSWRLLAQPTPGMLNADPATLGSAASLRINEWMALPSAGDDWIELYNSDTLPVDLSGTYLSDDASLSARTNTAIAARSYIAPHGYAVFDATGDATAAANATNFKIATEGEALRLYSPTLAPLDGVDFGLALNGISRGRYTDGSATQRDFPGTPSRGFANYIDSDDDGIPDAWEIANGLNPLVADADLDMDGDSQTNLQEYRAGTDPRDGHSVFVTAIAADVTGFIISFKAQQDLNYTVQYRDSLLEEGWLKLRDVPAGAVRTVQVADPGATGKSRFYRVITPRQP